MIENSFYGGRPGFSCVVVKYFSSIDAMKAKFELGGNYSEVHYNEYVLINTENKNDPDNGKLYRRGYDYTNDMAGAIYVGTIVGPAGRAPHLELTTIDKVKEKQKSEGYESRFTEGEYKPTVNLVPGKKSDGTFNDSIKWACCSVRNENGEDTTAYIGFIIPYLVEEFEASSVSAYFNRSSQDANFTNTGLIARMDNQEHPYYEKWKISVPKGIKGDTFKNFKVIEATEAVNYGSNASLKADDVAKKRKILAYEYYHYDKKEDGEPVTMYLGDFNMITGITISDEGTVTIDYTHDDDKVYNKLFKWIRSVSLNKDTGKFTVEYNQKDAAGAYTKYETDLTWVKNITIADNGDVTLDYSYGVDAKVGHLKWIKQTTVADNGTITVTYNDSTQDVIKDKIQWIKNISLTSAGVFTVEYNNGKPNYTANLRWVSDVVVAENGDVTIQYNDNESPTRHPKYFKTISNVSINTNNGSGEGTGNQKVHITYNTGDSADIGEPLNYIIETDITEDYHYVVYYSDPAKRAAIPAGKKRNYKGKSDWLDLGSVKDDDGILIGLNVDTKDHPDLISNIPGSIKYLTDQYPNGLTEPDLKGKIVTVGSTEANDKKFYAFDYTKVDGKYKGWYYLGAIEIDLSSAYIFGKTTDSDIESKKTLLEPNGLWFVVKG